MTSSTVDFTTTTGGFERIAYHEAGHVAVHGHFERPTFLNRGYVLIAAAGYGRTGLDSSDTWVWETSTESTQIDHASVIVAMAGRAAEAIQYPNLTPAELAQLSLPSDEPLARRYIRVLYGSNLSHGDMTDRIKLAEVEASQILRGVWAGVKALAETLLDRLDTKMVDNEVTLTGAEALHVMDTALNGPSP